MLAIPARIHAAAQRTRLAERLPRWLRRIPAYQQAAVPFHGGRTLGDGPEELARLPLITKADIRRDFPRNFLGPEAALEDLIDRGLVELEHTSGTSAERTPLLLARGWWAVQEQRALRLNGFVASVLDEHPEVRRVTITSPACNNDVCYTGRPSRGDRVVGGALHANLSRHPFLWSEAEIDRMVTETSDWAPDFLDVDPVYGTVFALHCERKRVRLPSLRFIVSSYEFLSIGHRRCLERVFGVPVFDLYGSTETGHLLMEPDRESPSATETSPAFAGVNRPSRPARAELRASHETAVLEVLQPDEQQIGELVVTTLDNEFMPLIRYRIGDLVERRGDPSEPTYALHGRVVDAARTPDGRRVTVAQVDACFADLTGIAHYALHETPGAEWILRYVTDTRGPSDAGLERLREALGNLLGVGAPVVAFRTETLLAEPSGKFRLCRPQH